MSTFHLVIYTPIGKYLDTNVEFLQVRNSDSVLGILPKHTPLITTTIISPIKINIHGNVHYYAAGEGILNVKKDGSVSLMVSSIEKSDEIDKERALKAKRRALDLLNDPNSDKDRAKKALKRAENRLEVLENK